MQRFFLISNPSTITLPGIITGKVFVYRVKPNQTKLHYFRHLTKGLKDVSFNLPKPGKYLILTDTDAKIDINPIRIRGVKYNLIAPPDRNNFLDTDKINFRVNSSLTHTPARISPGNNILEVSKEFLQFPEQVQEFILFHEFGHYYYKDEKDADLYALNRFVKEGYNASQAFYALDNILKHSEDNEKRKNNVKQLIFKEND